jgi:hypothetical protein
MYTHFNDIVFYAPILRSEGSYTLKGLRAWYVAQRPVPNTAEHYSSVCVLEFVTPITPGANFKF